MPATSGWLKRDKDFIELLIYYEENNAFGKDYSKDSSVWKEISSRVNFPAGYCRKKWLGIKYTYLKLKNMIRIGRVTEDKVRKNKKTAKYLDGRLDLLDRFLSEIPDSTLPTSVHRFFAASFDEEADSSTHSVDAEKLIKVQKNGTLIQVIKDYKQETGSEPQSILPNMEQAIEEEYRIDDDSNGVEIVMPLHTIILPNTLHQDNPIDDIVHVPTVPSSSTQTRKKIGSKPNQQAGDCNLAHFLVKYTNTNIANEETCDLKEYMADLAEVLCNRLAPDKRKNFLSQIDLIVSEMLEGTPHLI